MSGHVTGPDLRALVVNDVLNPKPGGSGLTGKALIDYVQYTQWFGAGGGIENKHSTNVDTRTQSPFGPCVCIGMHPEGTSCSDIGSSACSKSPSCGDAPFGLDRDEGAQAVGNAHIFPSRIQRVLIPRFLLRVEWHPVTWRAIFASRKSHCCPQRQQLIFNLVFSNICSEKSEFHPPRHPTHVYPCRFLELDGFL